MPLDDAMPRQRYRLNTRLLYEVNNNHPVARPQHSGRKFDDAREHGGIANRPEFFGAVSGKHAEMFGSKECSCYRLKLLSSKFLSKAFYMKTAAAMIACVSVPTAVCTRHQNINIALWVSLNPQRQPQLITIAKRNGVSIFVRPQWLEVNQANRTGRLAFLIYAAPRFQFV